MDSVCRFVSTTIHGTIVPTASILPVIPMGSIGTIAKFDHKMA